MLKKWIEQIKQEQEYENEQDGPAFWWYNLSGNMLELFVHSPFEKDHQSFRLAVMKAGRVLQVLAAKLEEQNVQYHIQRFPSLEDSQLIATVRVQNPSHAKPVSFRPVPFSTDGPESTPLINTIIHLATNYQFCFCEKANTSPPPSPTTPLRLKRVQWFILRSKYNNPFTWLKVGAWQEQVQRLYRKRENEKQLIFISDIPVQNDRQSRHGTHINDHPFIQVYVGFPCNE